MKVLFVAPRFPAPLTQGDRLRGYYLLRELATRHDITLVAPPGDGSSQYASDICRRWIPVYENRPAQAFGLVQGLFEDFPLQTALMCSPTMRRITRGLQEAEQFDIVHLHTARVGPAALPTSARVLDFIDAVSLNLQRRAEYEPLPKRAALDFESRRMRRYEQRLAQECDQLLISSRLDRDAIGSSEHIQVVPNGVDVTALRYVEDGRDAQTVMFTGRMGYFPNADAARFFTGEVWPLIRRELPGARLEIVGADPPPSVVKLGQQAGVVVTGRVERIDVYLQRATVAVAPLRAGTGLQLKVLEAMACGAPVVGTPRTLDGLGVTDGREAIMARQPEALACAVVELIRNQPARTAIARQARALVEHEYAWHQIAQQVDSAYEAARSRRMARGRHP